MLSPQTGKPVLGLKSNTIKSIVTFKWFRPGVKATVIETGHFMWLLGFRSMNLHEC